MVATEACPTVADAAYDGASVEHLHRRIAELTEAVAARDAFITVAGHDLRNAMTPVVGQVDLLMSSVAAGNCPPQEVERRLGRVQRTVIRYLKRAKVLLDVSRLTNGKLRLNPESFDFAEMLRQLADDLRSTARRSGPGVQVAAPDSLRVTLDQPATEQIVSTLVINALHHDARTPVEVSASVAGQQLRVQIRDNGSGISAADQPRFSGCFERAVLEGGGSGFGVGLWIVGQFVAAMEGALTIEDAPDGGALLTVTLPLHAKEASY